MAFANAETFSANDQLHQNPLNGVARKKLSRANNIIHSFILITHNIIHTSVVNNIRENV